MQILLTLFFLLAILRILVVFVLCVVVIVVLQLLMVNVFRQNVFRVVHDLNGGLMIRFARQTTFLDRSGVVQGLVDDGLVVLLLLLLVNDHRMVEEIGFVTSAGRWNGAQLDGGWDGNGRRHLGLVDHCLHGEGFHVGRTVHHFERYIGRSVGSFLGQVMWFGRSGLMRGLKVSGSRNGNDRHFFSGRCCG